MSRYLYFNNQCLPESETRIPAFCRGLLYGDGLFETVRVYSGKPFRLDDHLQRLFAGLNHIGITDICLLKKINAAVTELLNCSSLANASLKIVVFRQGSEWIDPEPESTADFFITIRPFDIERKKLCERGISAFVASSRRNNFSSVCSLKSLNCLENILGRVEARQHGADEAIFLNCNGFLAEGSISNIFLIKNNILYTPPPQAGILKGITRDIVLALAGKLSITFFETDILINELIHADEAFCTNSIMEIMPLLSVNNEQIGIGTPGIITSGLMNAYTDLVRKELA